MSLSVSITAPQLGEFIRFAGLLGKDYTEKVERLHRKVVFEALKSLILLTPVITGRLRAGWTALLDKYQIDYSRQFLQKSPETSPAQAGQMGFDFQAINEGKAQSRFEDTPLDTTIINGVVYGEFVNNRFNFVDRVRLKAELKYQEVFEKFHERLAKEGKVPPVNFQDDDPIR